MLLYRPGTKQMTTSQQAALHKQADAKTHFDSAKRPKPAGCIKTFCVGVSNDVELGGTRSFCL
jgi:hypothetical protein